MAVGSGQNRERVQNKREKSTTPKGETRAAVLQGLLSDNAGERCSLSSFFLFSLLFFFEDTGRASRESQIRADNNFFLRFRDLLAALEARMRSLVKFYSKTRE